MYCPVGSLSTVAVADGYYSAPAVGVVTNATDIMAQQVECPTGFYCAYGMRTACPAGTYQPSTGKSSVADCNPCSAGGYCPSGSSVSIPCGSDSVYCPGGASAPLVRWCGSRMRSHSCVYQLSDGLEGV